VKIEVRPVAGFKDWIIWTAFVAVNLTSVYIDRYLWLLKHQLDILQLLAFPALALGAWIVFSSSRRLLAAFAVLIVLVVGQLAVIQFLYAMLIWSIVGFAP
jgi:hypothetical protein